MAVDLDERTVSGDRAATEPTAIQAAQRLIDDALVPGKRRLRLVGPCRDGCSSGRDEPAAEEASDGNQVETPQTLMKEILKDLDEAMKEFAAAAAEVRR
jgi:hypothetical protein